MAVEIDRVFGELCGRGWSVVACSIAWPMEDSSGICCDSRISIISKVPAVIEFPANAAMRSGGKVPRAWDRPLKGGALESGAFSFDVS